MPRTVTFCVLGGHLSMAVMGQTHVPSPFSVILHECEEQHFFFFNSFGPKLCVGFRGVEF